MVGYGHGMGIVGHSWAWVGMGMEALGMEALGMKVWLEG